MRTRETGSRDSTGERGSPTGPPLAQRHQSDLGRLGDSLRIAVPTGFLGFVLVSDVLHLFTSSPFWLDASFNTLLAGAAVAAITWIATAAPVRSDRAPGFGPMLTAAGLYASSLAFRAGPLADPSTAMLLSGGGLMLFALCGWLGRQLAPTFRRPPPSPAGSRHHVARTAPKTP